MFFNSRFEGHFVVDTFYMVRERIPIFENKKVSDSIFSTLGKKKLNLLDRVDLKEQVLEKLFFK